MPSHEFIASQSTGSSLLRLKTTTNILWYHGRYVRRIYLWPVDCTYCYKRPVISWTGHQCFHVMRSLYPDSKVHGANMGPTWVLSAPYGPHVGPINLAIRDISRVFLYIMIAAIWQRFTLRAFYEINTFGRLESTLNIMPCVFTLDTTVLNTLGFRDDRRSADDIFKFILYQEIYYLYLEIIKSFKSRHALDIQSSQWRNV